MAGNFVLLHALSPLWPGDGSDSMSGVIQASDGYFYGTTESGYGGIFRTDATGNSPSSTASIRTPVTAGGLSAA